MIYMRIGSLCCDAASGALYWRAQQLKDTSMDMMVDGHRAKVEPPAPDDLALRTRHQPARVSLALQGGGTFGAFTWGVLDRLLEEDGLELDTVSGASAGAMNAIVLAAGLEAGGPGRGRR